MVQLLAADGAAAGVDDMTLTFGSLFSGIGGFDLGFERAGMRCAWQVENDKHCDEVLARRFPNCERFRDVHDVGAENLIRPDVICGGFPCQDLSVAGRRAGLAGERSGLWREFRRVIAEVAPGWVCIENVPGLLSSSGGRDMGTVLGSLAELGYGYAYRVLDSQWFGVPQRRRRVFIVGCLGDVRRACEVLFERDNVPWDSPPSRETEQEVAGCVHGSPYANRGTEESRLVVNSLTKQMANGRDDNAGQAGHIFAFQSRYSDNGKGAPSDIAYALTNHGNGGQTERRPQCVDGDMRVRRLTPLECERLQSFPDGWTEGVSDSARYRCLGNAVTVNVAQWIGERIVRHYAGRLPGGEG